MTPKKSTKAEKEENINEDNVLNQIQVVGSSGK